MREDSIASDIFHITPKHATDLAQLVHNEIELNGELDERRVVEVLCDQYADWLYNNVDWRAILDADQDVKDTIAERDNARKGY